MSRRLDTTVCRRSASASIVLLNDRTSLVDHSTSVLRRLVAAALMLASGVRRSWETAARSASRTLFASARADAVAASVWSRSAVWTSCSCATNAASSLRSSVVSARPDTTSIEPFTSSAA